MRYEDLNMSDFQGWIKLYRQIQNKGYYKKSHYVHLWVHLLLNANHKDKEFMWNGDLILIKEGQLLTGRKELSAETGISQSTIERILKMLENEHQIMQRKTTKFRIITIINWKDFQGGQQTDNKRTTNGQQADTNKNDKNEENEKNIKIYDEKELKKMEDKEIIKEKFNLFWNKYPRKTGKKPCEKTFEKLDPDDELMNGIITALDAQLSIGMLDKGQYTPHPATWLNQERWTDELINKGGSNGRSDAKRYEFQKGDGKEFKVLS